MSTLSTLLPPSSTSFKRILVHGNEWTWDTQLWKKRCVMPGVHGHVVTATRMNQFSMTPLQVCARPSNDTPSQFMMYISSIIRDVFHTPLTHVHLNKWERFQSRAERISVSKIFGLRRRYRVSCCACVLYAKHLKVRKHDLNNHRQTKLAAIPAS
jgi:hypothetical protein